MSKIHRLDPNDQHAIAQEVAMEVDREYFRTHPGEKYYTRAHIPHEFPSQVYEEGEVISVTVRASNSARHESKDASSENKGSVQRKKEGQAMSKKNKLTLHQALLELQRLNAAIRLTPRSIAIWSPNTAIPSLVRKTIQQHKAEIREMILASRIEVCPSPLHRREWYFPFENWTIDSATCAVCQRLACINESRPSKSNYDKVKVPARERIVS